MRAKTKVSIEIELYAVRGIMKKFLIIIALLCVRIEGDRLGELRSRIPPTDSEIHILMNRVFDDIAVLRRLAIIGVDDDIPIDFENNTLSHYSVALNDQLKTLKDNFASMCHEFVKKSLAIFCVFAIEELDKITVKKSYVPVPQDLIDKIKFDVDQDYCIFPFLFHYGHDVETMEATVYFLKTFELNKSLFVVFTLRKKIKELLKKLFIVTENGYPINEIDVIDSVSRLKRAHSGTEKNLAYSKELVLKISKLFCLTTAPRRIVTDKSLLKNELEDYQKKVIGFMINNEACYINVSMQ